MGSVVSVDRIWFDFNHRMVTVHDGWGFVVDMKKAELADEGVDL